MDGTDSVAVKETGEKEEPVAEEEEEEELALISLILFFPLSFGFVSSDTI